MKVSIITVCYNAEKCIEKTIQSVLNQNYDNIEYIIIDGESKDKTISVINKYIDKINFFISEKDTGIYNAMNKGIKNSTGDILLFLNSGDFLLHDKVISLVVNNFDKTDFFVYGNIITLDEQTGKTSLVKFPNPTRKFIFYNYIPHPSSFYRKELFEKYGLYNENNKIVSDYEFTLFMLENNIKMKYIDVTTSVFYLGGVSQVDNKIVIEKINVIKKYFSKMEIAFYNNKIVRFINRYLWHY